MAEKKSGFVAEFKQFIARGNVMDMAVGVIVGGAFKAIADSLTADIIMPIIGIFVRENSFADLSVTVGSAVITYGNFIQAILNFLKGINSFHRKKEEALAEPPAPPELSHEEALLMEIRDLLKENDKHV